MEAALYNPYESDETTVLALDVSGSMYFNMGPAAGLLKSILGESNFPKEKMSLVTFSDSTVPRPLTYIPRVEGITNVASFFRHLANLAGKLCPNTTMNVVIVTDGIHNATSDEDLHQSIIEATKVFKTNGIRLNLDMILIGWYCINNPWPLTMVSGLSSHRHLIGEIRMAMVDSCPETYPHQESHAWSINTVDKPDLHDLMVATAACLAPPCLRDEVKIWRDTMAQQAKGSGENQQTLSLDTAIAAYHVSSEQLTQLFENNKVSWEGFLLWLSKQKIPTGKAMVAYLLEWSVCKKTDIKLPSLFFGKIPAGLTDEDIKKIFEMFCQFPESLSVILSIPSVTTVNPQTQELSTTTLLTYILKGLIPIIDPLQVVEHGSVGGIVRHNVLFHVLTIIGAARNPGCPPLSKFCTLLEQIPEWWCNRLLLDYITSKEFAPKLLAPGRLQELWGTLMQDYHTSSGTQATTFSNAETEACGQIPLSLLAFLLCRGDMPMADAMKVPLATLRKFFTSLSTSGIDHSDLKLKPFEFLVLLVRALNLNVDIPEENTPETLPAFSKQVAREFYIQGYNWDKEMKTLQGATGERVTMCDVMNGICVAIRAAKDKIAAFARVISSLQKTIDDGKNPIAVADAHNAEYHKLTEEKNLAEQELAQMKAELVAFQEKVQNSPPFDMASYLTSPAYAAYQNTGRRLSDINYNICIARYYPNRCGTTRPIDLSELERQKELLQAQLDADPRKKYENESRTLQVAITKLQNAIRTLEKNTIHCYQSRLNNMGGLKHPDKIVEDAQAAQHTLDDTTEALKSHKNLVKAFSAFTNANELTFDPLILMLVEMAGALGMDRELVSRLEKEMKAMVFDLNPNGWRLHDIPHSIEALECSVFWYMWINSPFPHMFESARQEIVDCHFQTWPTTSCQPGERFHCSDCGFEGPKANNHLRVFGMKTVRGFANQVNVCAALDEKSLLQLNVGKLSPYDVLLLHLYAKEVAKRCKKNTAAIQMILQIFPKYRDEIIGIAPSAAATAAVILNKVPLVELATSALITELQLFMPFEQFKKYVDEKTSVLTTCRSSFAAYWVDLIMKGCPLILHLKTLKMEDFLKTQ